VFGPAWTLFGPRETVDTVNAVTGWDVTLDELMKLGERRINMLRAFNTREGFARKDDRLPDKFFVPLKGTGPTANVAVDRDQLEAAIDQYYGLMGWTNNGISTPVKMAELGLEWVEMPVQTGI
jgi:aldehyde:ferredoxin oxidoreductase